MKGLLLASKFGSVFATGERKLCGVHEAFAGIGYSNLAVLCHHYREARYRNNSSPPHRRLVLSVNFQSLSIVLQIRPPTPDCQRAELRPHVYIEAAPLGE